MPLEIAFPIPPTQFGPGSIFRVVQTDIGPIPFDDTIEVSIRDINEQLYWGWMSRLANSVNSWGGLWVTSPKGFVGQGWTTQLAEHPIATEGQALRLLAEQKHANGTIVGSISIPITYSPTVTAWVSDAFTTPTTTTPDPSDQLDRIESAVYQVFPHA